MDTFKFSNEVGIILVWFIVVVEETSGLVVDLCALIQNKMNSVFPTFTAILLARNHQAILESSALTYSKRFSVFSLLARQMVSSAYLIVAREDALYVIKIIRNKIGPKILPSFTEMLKICSVESLPLMSTF